MAPTKTIPTAVMDQPEDVHYVTNDLTAGYKL